MKGNIYWFEETGEWWMASGNALSDMRVLAQHIDAIRVTNPEVLDPDFVEMLAEEARLRG